MRLIATQLQCQKTGICRRNLHCGVITTKKGLFPDHGASKIAWHLKFISPDIAKPGRRKAIGSSKLNWDTQGTSGTGGRPWGASPNPESNQNKDPRIC